jgi:hypothetical protein
VLRYLSITVLSLAAISTLNAGQIQLSGTGVANNNIAGFGLTGSSTTTGTQYLQSVSSCAGSQYNAAACSTASTTNAAKGSYISQLFNGATGTTPATGPDAATGLPNANGKMSASGLVDSLGNTIQFDLMDAPNGVSAGVNANYWRSASTGAMDIPVGLLNVDSVSTMIQDYWGITGGSNILLKFCFSSVSNDSTCSSGTLTQVQLLNGTEVRAGVVCSTASACQEDAGNANGQIATSLAASTVINANVTVKTANVWSSTFTGTATSATSPYSNVTGGGTVVLDAQQFLFSTSIFSGKFLSYIEISDSGAATTWSSNKSASRYALSAITVDQATATPEPSTILLFSAGLGAIVIGRRRRS